MSKGLWYWEYTIKIWDEIDEKEEIRSGVISAKTMAEAIEHLEDYFKDEIIEIQMLKAITDGPVFDFNGVMNDECNFDFVINRKL